MRMVLTWLCLLLTFVSFSSGFNLSNFEIPKQSVYNFEQNVDNNKPSVSINANKLVDYFIQDARPKLVKLQKKYKPKNFTGKSRQSAFIVTICFDYHGYDGHINGLTTLYRNGDVKVTIKKNLLTLELGLGLRKAELLYTLHADARIFKITRKIKVKVSGIAVRVVIVKDLAKFGSPRLQSLKVTDVGKGHCFVSGLGIFRKMVDSTTTKIFNHNRKKMGRAGEKALTKLLSKELSKIKF